MTEFNQVATIRVLGVGGRRWRKGSRFLYLQHRCAGYEKLSMSK